MSNPLPAIATILFIVGFFGWAMNDGPHDSPIRNRISEIFLCGMGILLLLIRLGV